MRRFTLILLSTICLLNFSCHKQETELTEVQAQQIAKSAIDIVKKVFEYSNNMDFESGLNHYSESSNSYFITDGIMHSLSDLKKAYKDIGPAVEDLHNTIERWNVHVLSQDIVTFTLPVKLKLKLKGIPEYTGQLIWTATLQKQEDRWMIVQSHESWLNCAAVAAALIPTNGI
ncbi:nuclear transport factor 2 family protein [Gaetbulibacter aquiaggeris]|uniref:Nuclear transport factor 2 family protein n=1 Tax=Gaetbulibacter aquiaggeris TaxID=1735373 RepID=A0ABW7MTW6_9FLAO